MDARELRIGNYVDFEYGEENRTFGFLTTIEGADDLLGIENGNLKAQPIPLTEEWLLKLGFEKYGKTKLYKNTKGRVSVTLTSNQFGKFSGSSDFLLNDFYYIPIKHVHQLQNLYFALTGEELTIRHTTTN